MRADKQMSQEAFDILDEKPNQKLINSRNYTEIVEKGVTFQILLDIPHLPEFLEQEVTSHYWRCNEFAAPNEYSSAKSEWYYKQKKKKETYWIP